MGPKQILSLRVRVDLGEMATKRRFHTPQSSRTGASLSDTIKLLGVIPKIDNGKLVTTLFNYERRKHLFNPKK